MRILREGRSFLGRGVALAVFAAGLNGCGGEPPRPDVVIFPLPEDGITLSPVGWSDDTFRWYSVSVLNDSYFALELRGIEVHGEGAELLELEVPGEAPVVLPIRESRTIRLRVGRPVNGDRSIWTSRDYTATLQFQVGGTGTIDPETQEPDQSDYVTDAYEMQIKFSVDCDLDNDGFDSDICGGGRDCDDTLAAVRPDAIEICDNFDNDCNNVIDNGCIEE